MSDSLFRSSTPTWQELTLRLRLKLLENGYEPIAVVGKSPIVQQWQSCEITADSIKRDIASYPSATNTGLRTDRLPVIDIDLWNDDHVGDVGALVVERLGLTPLIRRGRKGLAMCYRLLGEPIGKLVIKEDSGKRSKPTTTAPNGNPIYETLVEILGRANQVVGYGRHPDTGKKYQWVGDSEPSRTPFECLPAVTPDQLRDLANAIRQKCAELGYKVKGVGVEGGDRSHPPPKSGSVTDAMDVTEMFLRLIPSGRQSPSGYINFPCPACRHNDLKSGIQVLPDGGFVFKCFHASCEYSRATGWRPPSWRVGERVIQLYELLGGDPIDLSLLNLLDGYSSMTEMLADLYQ